MPGGGFCWKESRRKSGADPAIAYLVTDMLKDVLTGKAPPPPQAPSKPSRCGKIGDISDNKSAHMIGFTPQLVSGVYVGDDCEIPLDHPAADWPRPVAWFMERALQDSDPLDFDLPGTSATHLP